MNEQIESFDDLVNRRQYFRIVDHVSLEVCQIAPHQSAIEKFNLNPEFGLISEFQLLDVESKHLLRALSEKDKNLGQFLKIMNKKMDALARVIAFNHQIIPPESLQEVNLSEGGIAFMHPIPYEKHDKLAIKLVLFPSYSGLLIEGKVLCCKQMNNDFQLHIEFLDISEAHQQLIARHIMRLQSLQKITQSNDETE
jgi:hypothetical protein